MKNYWDMFKYNYDLPWGEKIRLKTKMQHDYTDYLKLVKLIIA